MSINGIRIFTSQECIKTQDNERKVTHICNIYMLSCVTFVTFYSFKRVYLYNLQKRDIIILWLIIYTVNVKNY